MKINFLFGVSGVSRALLSSGEETRDGWLGADGDCAVRVTGGEDRTGVVTG